MVGEVENLVTVLVALVLDVVQVLLSELLHSALNTCITYNVQLAIEVVSTHDDIQITEQVLALCPLGVDDVTSLVIQKWVLNDSCLSSSKFGQSSLIKSLGQLVDVLHKLGLEVTLNANLVVHVHCRSNGETEGIGCKRDGHHARGILAISDNQLTSVADADASIIINHRSFDGVANRGAGLSLKLVGQNTSRVI